MPHGGKCEVKNLNSMKSINLISGTNLSSSQMRSIKGGEEPTPAACGSGCSITGGSSYTCAKDAMGNCGCKGTNSSGQMDIGSCTKK